MSDFKAKMQHIRFRLRLPTPQTVLGELTQRSHRLPGCIKWSTCKARDGKGQKGKVIKERERKGGDKGNEREWRGRKSAPPFQILGSATGSVVNK